MMVIENKFEIGGIIYLKTDPEQRQRLIVQIAVGGGAGSIRYCVSFGTQETLHYDMEMTLEKDQVLTFNDH